MTRHGVAVARSLCLAAALAWPAWAAAQAFPTKPIRLVVPYAPGAITDIAARITAERMSQQLGQQVIVDNRGGAGTRIGMQFVATAPADGYTLLFANAITHGTMPAMARSLPFDPLKDFAPVAPLYWYANVFVCNAQTPADTIPELIAYAKKNPGKLTNATAGPGSGHDLIGELFKTSTGVDILHVHYKGGGPALQDVLAGNVNCIYGDGAAKPHVDAGRLKALATAGPEPDPLFPKAPTMTSAGVKGFPVPIWQGIVAPAGTPPEVIARLNAAANEALRSPELQKRTQELNLHIDGGPPEKIGREMRDSMALFAKVVKDAKIQPQD